MPISCLILGAGGHAKVAIDACRRAHPGAAIEVRDDDPRKQGVLLLGVRVATPVGEGAVLKRACHVAIGDNARRRQIGEAVERAGGMLLAIVHPGAHVSPDARIDPGALVTAAAVLAPQSRVGRATIINHGAVIDHDCEVGDWTHIAPHAVLGGGVRVGASCLIGSGAVLLPGIVVGDHVVVGAGAVVRENVASGATVVGVPARKVR